MVNNEKVIEIKSCKHCQTSFEITDKDLEFYEKISPIFKDRKYFIPTPKLCPDCRQQRRLSFRNERKLYKRKCDGTRKDIISIYSPDKPYKVYEQNYWWSDNWDALNYGQDFDFNRGFFEQFGELMKEIPFAGNTSIGSENSDYAQMTNSKNCYYSFVGGYNEDILYSHWMIYSKDCIDCYRCGYLENSFNCINCYESFGLISCIQSIGSSECSFCWNINSCNRCFLSGNINNGKYFFKNQEFTAEEYSQKIEEYLKNHTITEIEEEMKLLMSMSINPQNQNIDTHNCTGDFILHSKECFFCFNISNSEKCKYYFDNGGGAENCMDNSYGLNSLWCYENVNAWGSKNIFNIMSFPDGNQMIYTLYCSSSSNLFGCIGLRNKSYCILNKQYTKEEYEILVPKIIEHMQKTGEWGEFFPSSISPFGYNETVAMEYFPLSRDKAMPYLYKWSTYEPPFPKVDKIIPANKLPVNISDIPDDILNRAIECEITKKPFRIIKQELEFYRKHNLPIPKRHPDQRHLDRMNLRNPRKLFDRKCDKCWKDIKTTYNPEGKEIVYCEDCYVGEIY